MSEPYMSVDTGSSGEARQAVVGHYLISLFLGFLAGMVAQVLAANRDAGHH